MVETKFIKVDELEINKGQLYGLPKNPRFIKDERFESLKKSIQEAPEMLDLRELLVYPLENGHYIIIGGNMRFRACKELGFDELPCKILPLETPVAKLREYTVKDNIAFGSTDWDVLANEWDTEELKEWGMEMGFLTNDEWDQLPEITEDQEDPVLDKPVKVQVIIPFDIKESESEIRTLLEETLKEYEGVEIK